MGCMVGWMTERVGGKMSRWSDGWVDGCKNGVMDEWIDGWMGRMMGQAGR